MEVLLPMIPNQCIEVQTDPNERLSVPAWFAEVVMVAQHLAKTGLLDILSRQVRLVRGRFGQYEPIDFLALLFGYAISGERTLSAFFERVSPFGAAFMALFGRADLPHRATLSRFLACVDVPCLEAFRTLFEQHSFAQMWTEDSLGGIWDRRGRRSIVFDVDATRQAARQRALPCDPTLPSPRRRHNGGLRPRLHWTKTRGGRTHAHRRATNAYSPMDWHLCRPRQWGLSRRTLLARFELSRVT
jgi:hypothetical protein